jgi:hypothetical protein
MLGLRAEGRSKFGIYGVLSVIGCIIATAVMFFGLGTTFLPSSTREQAKEVYAYFFSTWGLALVMLGVSRLLALKSRGPSRGMWTDIIIGIQAMICIAYLLWGVSHFIHDVR